MPNSKGVTINVYIESKNLKSNQENDPTKKINPKLSLSSKTRVFKTRGYDRRAQLLAYAHELRHANAQQEQRPFNNSRRKPKKWRWLLHAKKMRAFFSRFDGIKRRWNKYEPIVTEDYSDDGEGYSCNNQERMKSKKTYSRFCKKLRCFLKEISRACQCKNGGC